MSKSKIEWTDETWNPVTGCTKVSQGCKHCYAEREWPRLQKLVRAYTGRPFTNVRTHEDRLDAPLHWRRPRKVFVNSMSDLFHEDVPFEFIDRVFVVMAMRPQHTFQILTKRPARMREYLQRFTKIIQTSVPGTQFCFSPYNPKQIFVRYPGAKYQIDWPLPNVWLGVSIEDQATADERIPLLLDTPAAVRWVSAEPLLGPVDMTRLGAEKPCYIDALRGEMRSTAPISIDPSPPEYFEPLNWVVVGGESGTHARPMHPEWVRSLRDQCKAAGVAFNFKQWGEFGTSAYSVTTGHPVFREFTSKQMWINKAHTWVCGGICIDANGRQLLRGGDFDTAAYPVTIMHRVGKKKSGHLLDGVLHDEYPEVAA